VIRVIAETEKEREVVVLAMQDGSLSTALGGAALAGWYGEVKVGCQPAEPPAAPMGRHQKRPEPEPAA
jgi:hypothetical protein